MKRPSSPALLPSLFLLLLAADANAARQEEGPVEEAAAAQDQEPAAQPDGAAEDSAGAQDEGAAEGDAEEGQGGDDAAETPAPRLTEAEYLQWLRDETSLDDPVLLEWQRTVEDAETVARLTGKPLLICVNIDDEPASELFARHRYRDPAFGEHAAGFVPLIVSPARHTLRDHDDNGVRIECPRFQTVTCGEHQKIEQTVFERYFRGNRYAPRHVGVRLTDEGPEYLFDLFLLQDISPVVEALKEHGGWESLLASHYARDRKKVEFAYREGNVDLRTELLTLARNAPSTPVELLRLGMADEDPGLARLARQTLAATAGPESLDLLLEALANEHAPVARDTLRVALARLASTEARAARALRIEEGLSIPSARVPVDVWRTLLATRPRLNGDGDGDAAVQGIAELEERLDQLASQPESIESLLAIGNVHLDLAAAHLAAGGNPSYFLIDADHAANRAIELGADPTQAAAIRAPSLWLSGRANEAGDQAALAMASLVAEPASPRAAEVLDVLARSRTGALYSADPVGDEWSSEILREAHAAYSVLGIHPLGTDKQAADHSGLLRYLMRDRENEAVLRNALARFPESALVHAAFRAHAMATAGVENLDLAYEGMVELTAENSAVLSWWIGYAATVVAEEQRRATLTTAAAAAYGRAEGHFLRSMEENADYEDTSKHYLAMADAGRARIAIDRGQLEEAATRIGRAIAWRPASSENQDGLGRTPLSTLREVRRVLVEAQRDDLLEQLGAVIEEADPGLWTSSRGGFTQQ